MSLLAVDDISLSYGGRTLFDGDGLAIERGDRLGLVGPNGTGKSTLLKILANELTPDGGRVIRARGCRIGYLAQEIGGEPLAGSLLTMLLETAPGRELIEDRLAEVEERLADAGDTEEQMALSEELAALHEELADLDQSFGPHQAKRILAGLGFLEADFDRPVAELSGGWRMRAHLAALLYQRPDVLLLDEPTNHLDMPSVRWLSEFIDGFKHAIVLTCHDKEFLNRHVTRIASLEVEGLRTFRGNYDAYLEQRKIDLEHLENRIRASEQKRKELEQFVERFRAKATKARQAQSKAKQIEKLEAQAVEIPKPRSSISIRFAPVPRSGEVVLRTRGLTHGFGDRTLFSDLELNVRRGERVVMVGRNGAGKTTLLKLLAGEIAPRGGGVELGAGVVRSYFAQHHADALDPNRTVLEEVWSAAPDRSQTEVRSMCGAFLFSGDDVDKPIGVLSGGEKTRVALARILVEPGNLLLLDEPTNHLDTESAEKLTDSLLSYDGTLIFVSHSLDFARRLSTRVWSVEDGTVAPFPGSLRDYLDHVKGLQEEKEGVRSDRTLPKDKAARIEERRRRSAEQKKVSALRKKVAEAEEEVARIEEEKSSLEAKLGDPSTHDDPEQSRALSARYESLKRTLDRALENWTELSGELESLS